MSKGAKGEKSLKKITKDKLAEEEKHNYIGALEKKKQNHHMNIMFIL